MNGQLIESLCWQSASPWCLVGNEGMTYMDPDVDYMGPLPHSLLSTSLNFFGSKYSGPAFSLNSGWEDATPELLPQGVGLEWSV